MRCENDLGAFRGEVLNSREGSTDTGIVSDLLSRLVLFIEEREREKERWWECVSEKNEKARARANVKMQFCSSVVKM
jgi:hypothetical protein